MLRKAAALFLVCASIAPWIGCGTTKSSYLYATLPTVNEFVAFREDPNSGILTGLSFSPITAGQGVDAAVLHPSKQILYAANSGELPFGSVALFTIASNGVLTPGTTVNTGGSLPSLLAIDSAGQYLYVGNAGTNDISVFSIDPSSGALTAVVGSPFPLGFTPINMKVSPSGGVLYVTGAGAPQGYIEVFSINPGSTTSPFLNFVELDFAGANPYGLAISPNGNYLYTANTGDLTISEFSIDSSGKLTQLAGSPVQNGNAPAVALLIDNSGKYLYAANQVSGNVGAYAIGSSNGALQLLNNSPFVTVKGPSVLATDPTGKYLFVGGTGGQIESFSLNNSNGTLTQVGTYPAVNTPTSMVITH